jgi:preprotein translocase subunit SecA
VARHLYEMDYLKEGIGLRAMAQRDRWSVPAQN